MRRSVTAGTMSFGPRGTSPTVGLGRQDDESQEADPFVMAVPEIDGFAQMVQEKELVRKAGKAVMDGPESRLPLFFMLVEGELDDGLELAEFERFEKISERVGAFGPGQGQIVGVGRQVDERDRPLFLDDIGGLNSVDRSLEPDIEEDQVGGAVPDDGQGILGRRNDGLDVVPELDQHIADVMSDEEFVFDNEDSGFGHDSPPRQVL